MSDELVRFIDAGFVYVSEEQSLKYVAQVVAADDLVFTCWGTIGQVGIIPRSGGHEKYIISNKQLKLRVDPAICDPLYAYFYFGGKDGVEYVRSHAKGAAVPGISLGILKGLRIALPPLVTQRRIVSILSTYDDLIENNASRIAILEEMARRLYEEWFVKFRFPGHDGEVKDDGLPGGWRQGPISDLYQGLYDGPHATPKPSDEGPVFLGIGNLTESGRLDLADVRHIAEEDFGHWTKRVCPQPGDIVFTYEATLNRYAIIPRGFRGCLGRRLALIRVDPKASSNLFLYCMFFSPTWREVVAQNTLSGATVDRIPLSKFPQFPVTIPPPEVIARFDELVRPMLAQAEGLNQKNANLRAQRDLLLPKLISGEIDVSQSEADKKELVA